MWRTLPTDHPRACGANPFEWVPNLKGSGSSPRMRGKRYGEANGTVTMRIIPAHAGQTMAPASSTIPRPDHPRACGANDVNTFVDDQARGSSPRMRGKPYISALPVRVMRIIPAHAGQTCRLPYNYSSHSDHPRACGANSNSPYWLVSKDGSSPRMRGKRFSLVFLFLTCRIIPAHAGQTPAPLRSLSRCPDHPRACGANHLVHAFDGLHPGSSPRMRGKPGRTVHEAGARRIIPAHAGQTVANQETGEINPDHPRACGANGEFLSDTRVKCGSSPRMRGNLSRRPRLAYPARIIPAHAGQTRRCVVTQDFSADHPRACGANIQSSGTEKKERGSSPRMRGKHWTGVWGTTASRIIPAHAGQTR